jgi:hypothetical protein
LSKELNELLIQAYHDWSSEPDPIIPLSLIREYLELEGVKLENGNKEGVE